MRVKLTNPLATGTFAVSARLSYAMLSCSICPGARARLSLVAGSTMHCQVALVRGGRGEVLMIGGVMATVGGVIVRDWGRMLIVLWGWSSGVNVTNFAVCCVTVPVVLACFGWNNVMVTRHPMGKLMEGSGFVTIVGGVLDLGGGSCAAMHLEFALCAQRNAHWMVLAAVCVRTRW
jgi:hypothetical protein